MRSPRGLAQSEPLRGDLLFSKVNKTEPTPLMFCGEWQQVSLAWTLPRALLFEKSKIKNSTNATKEEANMAIFHLEVSVIGRSKGQSAVASSAYQAGELLPEEETGTKKNFQAKAKEIQYKKILLPEYAPKEYQDRTTLWNAVQAKEKSKNARFARKINVALPNELSRVEQVALLESYVQETFVDKGMIADIAIHDKSDGNPHAHIMLTTRAFKKNGKWAPKQRSEYKLDEQGNRIPLIDPKTGKQKLGARNAKQWKKINLPYTDWDRPGKVEEWRAKWAEIANEYLVQANAPKIDHRSYERIEQETGEEMPIPTIHEGYYAREIEKKKPGSSWKVEINRNIERLNRLIEELQKQAIAFLERIREIIKEKELKAKEKELVEDQSQAVAQPEPAKQPQKAHIEHKKLTEEEVYARLTEIFAGSREDAKRSGAREEAERELEASLSRLREREQTLASETTAVERREREAKSRESALKFQSFRVAKAHNRSGEHGLGNRKQEAEREKPAVDSKEPELEYPSYPSPSPGEEEPDFDL